MSVTRILRVLFAIFVSGLTGWISLFTFHFIRITQHFVVFEVSGSDSSFVRLANSMEDAIRNAEGASALFLALAIAGVLLSEIFKVRPLLFYAGATGALTAIFAAALWQQTSAPGNAQTAAALAMAGFVAGGVYWLLAVPSAPRQ
jgi:hypothetical protein